MPLPTKIYCRLSVLRDRWGISQEDLFYVVENGMLKTAIWLPLRWVERGVMKNRKFIYETHEHIEGFVIVRANDTRIVLSHGRAKLRTFTSVTNPDQLLRLAYEPPQPDISVRIDDLVVLQQHQHEFEKTYSLSEIIPKNEDAEQELKLSNDYRHIMIDEKEYFFGDVQGKIISILHDAAQSRNPWVHGKTLLYESGATAPRVRDVFKHKKNGEI